MINTHVMIEDQGIVVLGGLIRDSNVEGESRVPFLGRIPLIGEAFKSRNAKHQKSNLMVFIRPKILRDGMQTSMETNAKYNIIRSEQQRVNQRGSADFPLLPTEAPPLLPVAPPPPPGALSPPSKDTTP